jgi:hypothetical protein
MTSWLSRRLIGLGLPFLEKIECVCEMRMRDQQRHYFSSEKVQFISEFDTKLPQAYSNIRGRIDASMFLSQVRTIYCSRWHIIRTFRRHHTKPKEKPTWIN